MGGYRQPRAGKSEAISWVPKINMEIIVEYRNHTGDLVVIANTKTICPVVRSTTLGKQGNEA